MSLLEQITTDMKEAMKAKNEVQLSTLRMLKSAIKNKQIDAPADLTDEDVLAVVKSQIKQLRDSLESFTSAGREDLASGVTAELAILEAYMPAQMSDEELEGHIKAAIEEVGATSKADMGKAMGAAMKRVGSGADGTRVKDLVAKLLPVLATVLVLAGSADPALAADAETGAFVVPAIRIGRAFLLLFGIVSINLMLIGGFNYMVASGRDDSHNDSIQKIATGVLGTIVVAALFVIATIALENLT